MDSDYSEESVEEVNKPSTLRGGGGGGGRLWEKNAMWQWLGGGRGRGQQTQCAIEEQI